MDKEKRRKEKSKSYDDYVYGLNSVKELLKSDRTINSVLVSNKNLSRELEALLKEIKKRKILIKKVQVEKLKEVSGGGNHQSIAANVSPYDYYSLDDLINDTEQNSKIVLALDGINDVHNLGAIIRTMEACGIIYLILPERRSVSMTSTVSKTSSGAALHVKPIRVKNLTNAIEELKKNSYWVLGTDAKAEQTCFEFDYDSKLVIVIGSEGKGISQNLRKKCDFVVSIPMYGKVNSLNASVSASIVMYQALMANKNKNC